MGHTIVFHSISLGKKMQKAIGLKAPHLGLSYSQASALTVLESGKNISQSEIASRLSLEPATIVTLVDELERLKLVRRLSHNHDRRKYHISLTTKGQEIAKKIKSRSTKLESFLRNKLTKNEAKLIMNIHEKLINLLKEWKGGENEISSPKRSMAA